MNEQIRELVRKAGGHFSTRNLMSNPPQQVEFIELWDDRIEKFAELIVRECAELNFRSTGHVNADGEIAIGDMIRKHFGIEE